MVAPMSTIGVVTVMITVVMMTMIARLLNAHLGITLIRESRRSTHDQQSDQKGEYSIFSPRRLTF